MGLACLQARWVQNILASVDKNMPSIALLIAAALKLK